MVALLSGTLSGLAHGGGGFIIGPYWLISGMSPAQGATTGAFMSTGIAVSSLAAFRQTKHLPTDSKLAYALSIVGICAAVVGALILPQIDVPTFKTILAVITLATVPLLFRQPKIIQNMTDNPRLGFGIASLLLIIGSIINGSAISILFTLTLITFFNMPIVKVTALRRFVGTGQSVTLFIVLATQGFFVWQHALLALIGGSAGSYVGTKYAIRRGEMFAKYLLSIIGIIGSLALLLGA